MQALNGGSGMIHVMAALPIHPFPARMAPEVALSHCCALDAGSIVLDPMAGSGTVLRMAAEQGLIGLGFDADPLAVLMARVWTTPVDPHALRRAAHDIVAEVASLSLESALLPWIDQDSATSAFIDYWFGPRQQLDLRRLSAALASRQGPVADGLRIALSRIIVTKDRGASLGRDVSHSRPHKAYKENDFPVMREFVRSAERVARRLESQPPIGNVMVEMGDARNLEGVVSGTIDAVVTSPPYLNALDYIRGHRLSLVWLGYRVGDLRTIRADSIGAERAPEPEADRSVAQALAPALGELGDLPPRVRGMVDRYLIDLLGVLREVRRTLKPGGQATFVIGNSCLRNVFVDNAAAVAAAAERVGLTAIGRSERDLPPSRRYLPPPAGRHPSDLAKRMRTEVVLSFVG